MLRTHLYITKKCAQVYGNKYLQLQTRHHYIIINYLINSLNISFIHFYMEYKQTHEKKAPLITKLFSFFYFGIKMMKKHTSA